MNSIKTLEIPMSRSSAAGTEEGSLCRLQRFKKFAKVVMAALSLSASNKRACVRMTAERGIHVGFIILDSWVALRDACSVGGRADLPARG
jgi:hypothetical protein